MTDDKLDKIFNPKTIAIIGATSREGSVGHALMKNLMGSGFKGIVFPINHKRESVMGIKAYPSLKKVPDKVDLAIIVTPAKTVPSIVDECGRAGVGGLVIITAGFKEIGKAGEVMYQQIKDTAKSYGMRIIGPNCLGFLRPKLKLNASFANKMALPGRIAFISQSGALCTSILDWSVGQNVGFSYFVSIGSMADVGFHDLIDYFGNDPNTDSILIYMESLSDARKFLSAARAFARTKPIVVLKVGKCAEGAKAIMSHTGSVTSSDMVFDAAFKRAGILRVDTIEELFDCAETLAKQKRPQGKKLAIVTNAGGPGVIATDFLIGKGGKLAELSKSSISQLNKVLPAAWSHGNPVDVLGDAGAQHYTNAIKVCIKDKDVDGILIILTPQAMTDAAGIAKEIISLTDETEKTILASFMGQDDVAKGIKILEKAGIPVYHTPEDAIQSFMNLYSYAKNIDILYETPATTPHAFDPKTDENKKIIKQVIKDKRYTLTEEESKHFLANYDLPIGVFHVAKTATDAEKFSEKLGFPIAMKILSPDILHKTDVGGVKLNIENKTDAADAFKEIMTSAKKHKPKANIEGVIMERMISKKYELLIGCKKDPIFGPAIVFGMGGTAVELFKDTITALPPLNMALARRMIEGTKIFKLLEGYRGMAGVDLKTVQFYLYKFAYLLMDFPEIKELDINPLAIDKDGGVVLDAKVVLDKEIAGKDVKPYSHLVISPYPKEYITTFKMKNGKVATLRPIKPEDEPLEKEMFTKFSEETERFRFFKQIKEISHELLIRYTQNDYDREIAIIAEVTERDKKKMAGVARIIEGPAREDAEFAIVVADPWQKQGLGSKLTDYMIEIAKKRGVNKIFVEILPDNNKMLNMLKKRGFKLSFNEKVCHAEKEL